MSSIPWRDLVPLTLLERWWETTLPFPWLVASIVAYSLGWWPLGVFASFFFFLTGLRLSHNAQHHAIGLGRWGHDLVLFILSPLMLGSMHAVRVTHLQHHKHCLEEDDVEAGHVHFPWWLALLYGPVFIVELHRNAWRLGSRASRRWILLELVTILLMIGICLLHPALHWHLAAMVTGECLTAFFAVWIVHHGCHVETQLARTQRGWWTNLISYSMLYHLEHHLYPAVPTCHLKTLAARLDEANPTLSELQVL
jgi:fatty acid desaturase